MTSIIKPKFIICLGEDSQLSYFARKFLLSNFHGQQIGKFEDIPIFTTYEVSYYINDTGYEVEFYKNKIKNNDWENFRKFNMT